MKMRLVSETIATINITGGQSAPSFHKSSPMS